MASDTPRIVEQDGSIVRILCGDIEVVADLQRHGNEILLDRMSIDGPGVGKVGMPRLLSLARQFMRQPGAVRMRIRGTIRTTGANPGKNPREIVREIVIES